MWQVSRADLLLLKGGGGEPFLGFVSRLIRAEVAANGSPVSHVESTLRANVRDGGIDIRVPSAITRDSSGFLGEPTCWQCKAVDAAGITEGALREEIRKPFASELIRAGHAYRLCVLGDVTPQKKDAWEAVLLEEARNLSASAATPQVIGGEALSAWAQRYPGVVIDSFSRPSLRLMDLATWRKQITSSTPRYALVPAWETIHAQVVDHCSLGGDAPPSVCLPIRGEAGVGKTRLVFECVSSSPSSALVIYTNDEEKAKDLALEIVRRGAVAIVVADECSVESRLWIEQALSGSADRVRVICIDNRAQRLKSGKPELWLEEMPAEAVDAVLMANYPRVPLDRRRAYASLAGGFIRFAADLCQHDLQFAAGDISPALGSVEEYVFRSNRLREGDRLALEALCLLPRIGFNADLSGELDVLCSAVGIPRAEVEAAAGRLKDSPGFISRAGRYLYVTPALVARVGFLCAWDRWVGNDFRRFTESLGPLLDGFLEQVAAYGNEEIRRASAEFFRQALGTIDIGSLHDDSVVKFIETLVETNPAEYLAWLRRELESASLDEIQGLGGNRPGMATGSARRRLVWLAERFLAFPEQFHDAEAILYALGTVETEGYANNATAIWCQAFRVYLSGTSIPFLERLELLRGRALRASGSQHSLVVAALLGIFEPHHTRTLGQAVVAGRVPPSDWRPASGAEESHCFAEAFALLQTLESSGPAELQHLLRQAVVAKVALFARLGFAARVQEILAPDKLEPAARKALVTSLEDILYRPYGRSNRLSDSAFQQLEGWLSKLKPGDFHSSLVATLSRPAWHPFVRSRDGAASSQVRNLAERLVADDELLRRELLWLCSSEAQGAPVLGETLARLDEHGRLLQTLGTAAKDAASLGLLKGYLVGLLRHHEKHLESVRGLLDQLATIRPREMLEVLPLLNDRFDAVALAVRLVDSGRVDPSSLAAFAYGTRLTPTQFRDLVTRIAHSVSPDKPDAVDAGLHMLMALREADLSPQAEPELLESAWTIVEHAARNWSDRFSWEWQQVVTSLATVDPSRAARVVASVLVESARLGPDETMETLVALAKDHPRDVMEALGSILLHHENSWHLQVAVCKEVVAAIPADLVVEWLRREGLPGARRLARHLPVPKLDHAERPVVPPLTEFVLSEFGSDEETFVAFCAGTHGFEVAWGSGVEQAQEQADVARRFLDHRLERVREWADQEVRLQQGLAERWAQENAESRLP